MDNSDINKLKHEIENGMSLSVPNTPLWIAWELLGVCINNRHHYNDSIQLLIRDVMAALDSYLTREESK